MDQFACTIPIPVPWRIFDGIVTDRDDDIGGIEKPVARLVSQLSDSTAKILKQMSSDSASGLKSAHYRKMIFPDEVPEGKGVGRFARQ